MLQIFYVLFTRVTMVAAGLILSVIIAQLGGAEATGYFFITISVMSGFVLLLRGGLQEPLVRVLSVAHVKRDLLFLAQALRWVIIYNSLIGGAITVFLLLRAPAIGTALFDDPAVGGFVQLIAPAIPAMSLIWLMSSFLKSMDRPSASLVFEFNGMVCLAIPMLLIMGALGGFTVARAIIVVNIAAYIAAFIGLWTVRRAINRSGEAARPALNTDSAFGWHNVQSAYAPMLISNGTSYLLSMAPVLFVGAAIGVTEAGIFTIANRAARTIIVVNSITNAIYAPKMARQHADANPAGVRKTVRLAGRTAAALALPVLLIFMIFPHFVLSIFGDDLSSGVPYLRILAAGAFLEVALGPVGMGLTMMARERQVRNNMLIAAALFVATTAVWWQSPTALSFCVIITTIAVGVKIIMAVGLIKATGQST